MCPFDVFSQFSFHSHSTLKTPDFIVISDFHVRKASGHTNLALFAQPRSVRRRIGRTAEARRLPRYARGRCSLTRALAGWVAGWPRRRL
jgi:hypothetical protein